MLGLPQNGRLPFWDKVGLRICINNNALNLLIIQSWINNPPASADREAAADGSRRTPTTPTRQATVSNRLGEKRKPFVFPRRP
jgi:hypothetical protein